MTMPYAYSGETFSPVPAASVLPRICVSPPYYALEDLTYDGNLQARVNASQPQTSEVGPMRASEISRHAAIAGLVCAAMNRESSERHYYLATNAHYRGFKNDAPYGSDVRLEANASHSKRYAKASVELRAGTPLARLDVTYSVLKARLFDKLFAARHRDTPSVTSLAPLPHGELSGGTDRLERRLKVLPDECCAGHFENYPALPVALLVAEVSRLSELVLDTDTFIHEAKVRADKLCWAGDPITFRVERRGSEGRLHHFYGEAASTDGVGTQLEFVVEAL